jgi:hypothetical protein
MASQFAPVELSTIKQGQFSVKCEEEFQKLQGEFIEFTEKNKTTSTAELKMSVKISYDEKKKSYSIITQIEPKMSKPPATVTNAFAEQTENGQMRLWSQAAGTTKDNPRQTKLCAEDGRAVDLRTGKVKK